MRVPSAFLRLLLLASLVAPRSSAAGETSARVPLLVVPDHMGSVPPMKHAVSFAFRRGMPLEALELASDYDPLIATLEKAGYRREIDLFTVAWDWRMALAPDDGTSDGRILGLMDPLARRDLRYGAGYLGHALARVAAARPEAKEIDVLAHGLGGILVRAYLQSDAYGATVTQSGERTMDLPRVRRFVQVAVPSQGQPEAWNPWHGNFADLGPARDMARKVLPVAFQAVRTGNTIPGPDRPLDRKAIQRKDEVDPTKFYRLYDAGARALLPTYPFLARPAARGAVSSGPASNPLVLDLNARPPEALSWLDRVERAVITHGSGLPTTVAMRHRIGPDPRDPEARPILILPRLQGGDPIAPKPRQGWFEPIIEPAGGDGVVPLASLRPEATSDARVVYRAWRAPTATTAGAANAVATAGPVGHVDLLSNPEVLAWLVSELGPPPSASAELP